MREVHLERMRWPEIGQAHLPLFMDAEHGTRLGEEVARRMGRALVAPTIRVGCCLVTLADVLAEHLAAAT